MKLISLKLTHFLILGISSLFISAQQQVGIATVEVSADKKINDVLIEETAYRLLNAENDDSAFFYNDKLISILNTELNKEEALNHAFSRIQSISILTPPDSSFVLFNWNIPLTDGTFQYECGVLNKQTQGNNQFSFLKDTSFVDRETSERSTTLANYWSPCLFYKVIENQGRFQKYYTLLFWDGNNRLTNKKGIDVLWFDKTNSARFGAPLFKFNSQITQSRIIFEYGGQNRMKLQFNEVLNRIEYDHLSPPPPDDLNTTNLEGVYEYYGPDLSFDGFLWQNQAWHYQADIDMDSGLNKKAKDFKVDQEIKKEKVPIYTPNN